MASFSALRQCRLISTFTMFLQHIKWLLHKSYYLRLQIQGILAIHLEFWALGQAFVHLNSQNPFVFLDVGGSILCVGTDIWFGYFYAEGN